MIHVKSKTVSGQALLSIGMQSYMHILVDSWRHLLKYMQAHLCPCLQGGAKSPEFKTACVWDILTVQSRGW